jgi:hypothetical protein
VLALHEPDLRALSRLSGLDQAELRIGTLHVSTQRDLEGLRLAAVALGRAPRVKGLQPDSQHASRSAIAVELIPEEDRHPGAGAGVGADASASEMEVAAALGPMAHHLLHLELVRWRIQSGVVQALLDSGLGATCRTLVLRGCYTDVVVSGAGSSWSSEEHGESSSWEETLSHAADEAGQDIGESSEDDEDASSDGSDEQQASGSAIELDMPTDPELWRQLIEGLPQLQCLALDVNMWDGPQELYLEIDTLIRVLDGLRRRLVLQVMCSDQEVRGFFGGDDSLDVYSPGARLKLEFVDWE